MSSINFQVKSIIRNKHWEAKRLCVNRETGHMLVFRHPRVHPWRQNWCQKGLFQCYLKPAIWRQIWINQLAFWRVKWWPQLFTMKPTEGSTSLQQVGFSFVLIQGIPTQCGNFRIFLSLIFYVKSIVGTLEVLKRPILQLLGKFPPSKIANVF